MQGCQIFLGTTHQNRGNYAKLPQNTYTKCPRNSPTSSIAKPCKKIPRIRDFWFENAAPSGSTGHILVFHSGKGHLGTGAFAAFSLH
jgi:hypothetical protein